MLRRTTASLFLLMLNVMALGDGLVSLGGSQPCDLEPAGSADEQVGDSAKVKVRAGG